MANYFIEKVRKDDDGDIIKVKTVHSEFTTKEVIEKIEAGDNFFVMEGETKINVEVVSREGKKYIRTFKDGKETNNLDNLPTF